VARDSTDAATDPQAPDWGGLSWSSWHDFDQARDDRLIPGTCAARILDRRLELLFRLWA